MKKLLLVLVFLTGFVFAQENKIYITKDKFYNTIVTDVKNKKKNVIYDKIIKWISINYQDPSKVILSKINNEFIRFQGLSNLYWVQYSEPRTDYYAYPVKYTIEIFIKDNKYQFKIQKLETRIDRTFDDFNILTNPEYYYDKDGNFVSSQKPTEKGLPDYFNNLNKNLSDYILGASDKSLKEW